MRRGRMKRGSFSAVFGPNLWRSGFHVDSLSAINLMSGLVDVCEALWLEESAALVFVVRNRDKTGTLFKTGVLKGHKIQGFQPSRQSVMVSWVNSRKYERGGN